MQTSHLKGFLISLVIPVSNVDLMVGVLNGVAFPCFFHSKPSVRNASWRKNLPNAWYALSTSKRCAPSAFKPKPGKNLSLLRFSKRQLDPQGCLLFSPNKQSRTFQLKIKNEHLSERVFPNEQAHPEVWKIQDPFG